MKKIKCAVIGIGYLGKFHTEKYARLPNAELVAICDIDIDRCNEIASKYEHVRVTNNYYDLIGQVDAVSIVAPTALHHKIAKTFLDHHIHVLLEKPICTTVSEAEELIEIAKKNKLILQIGHLERFNTAIVALEKYLDNPRFIESIRIAPFKLRGSDVNVVLDLMIHDIDLIQFIIKSPIKQIHANGACVLSNQIDIANARIEFTNGCVANVTASRASLKQTRKLRLFQQENYISVDLMHKKLTLHHKGVNEMFPGVAEMVSEENAFDQGDALRDEIIAFLDAIIYKKNPIVSGEDGKTALATAIEITNIVKAQMDQEKSI